MHAQSLQSIINIPDNIIESRWETDSEKGRIRSAFMIGEVNLPEFLDSMYKEFMHDQHTDDGLSALEDDVRSLVS